MMVVKVQMREYRENYTDTTNECKQTKHTSSWLVIMWTLSHIITISFCFNLHSISTYVHIVQFSCRRSDLIVNSATGL